MSDEKLLVLHFDLNETILVTDPAGGDTFNNVLNKCIAKNVFIKAGVVPDLAQKPEFEGGVAKLDTSWRKNGEFTRFYQSPYRKQGKLFTEAGQHGESMRPFYAQLQQQLVWPGEACPPLSLDGNHFILPAFFKTVEQLHAQGRKFRVVIRTFGSDLDDVAEVHALRLLPHNIVNFNRLFFKTAVYANGCRWQAPALPCRAPESASRAGGRLPGTVRGRWHLSCHEPGADRA